MFPTSSKQPLVRTLGPKLPSPQIYTTTAPLNPQPSALNPKPLNTKPQTLSYALTPKSKGKPKPQATDPRPYIILKLSRKP